MDLLVLDAVVTRKTIIPAWGGVSPMVYVNKAGKRISQEEWSALFRRRSYAVTESTNVDGYTIETSWVGLALVGEEKPLVWLVTAKNNCMPGKDLWFWLKSAKEASHLHRDIVQKKSKEAKDK